MILEPYMIATMGNMTTQNAKCIHGMQHWQKCALRPDPPGPPSVTRICFLLLNSIDSIFFYQTNVCNGNGSLSSLKKHLFSNHCMEVYTIFQFDLIQQKSIQVRDVENQNIPQFPVDIMHYPRWEYRMIFTYNCLLRNDNYRMCYDKTRIQVTVASQKGV